MMTWKTGVWARAFAGGCGLLLVAMLVSATGCGKGDTILRGKVKYKGTELNGGGIQVHSTPSRQSGIAPDGSYEVKIAIAGKWKVTLDVPTDAGQKKSFAPQEALKDTKVGNKDTTPVEVEIRDGTTTVKDLEF